MEGNCCNRVRRMLFDSPESVRDSQGCRGNSSINIQVFQFTFNLNVFRAQGKMLRQPQFPRGFPQPQDTDLLALKIKDISPTCSAPGAMANA